MFSAADDRSLGSLGTSARVWICVQEREEERVTYAAVGGNQVQKTYKPQVRKEN